MFRSRPKTAIEWLARLKAGRVSAADQRALVRWVAADPARLGELEAAEAIDKMAADLGGSATARNLLSADLRAQFAAVQARRPSGVILIPLAAAAAAGLLFLFLTRGDSSGLPMLDNHNHASTGIGQIASYLLPDKSTVTVAASSMVAVDFSSARRDISLGRGEAYFDVRHDVERPFVIKAGTWSVTVTGTKFNVNTHAALRELDVAVIEGQVIVAYRTPAGLDEVQRVAAGDVFSFSDGGTPVRRRLTPAQAAAWRSHKVYFDRANLNQVLEEVNRYTRKPLVAESQDVGSVILTGQFEAGDIASVFTALHQLHGIDAEETGTQWLLKRTPKEPVRRN